MNIYILIRFKSKVCKRTTDKTRKEDQVIQEHAKVCQISTLLRQNRINWYGHIRRSEEYNLSRKMMDMAVPRKRRRGQPRRRWIDNTRQDMNKYEMTADMTKTIQNWTMMVRWSLKV